MIKCREHLEPVHQLQYGISEADHRYGRILHGGVRPVSQGRGRNLNLRSGDKMATQKYFHSQR